MLWSDMPLTSESDPWQDVGFLNMMIRATNQRRATIRQLSGSSSPSDFPEGESGDDMQTHLTGVLNLREDLRLGSGAVQWVAPDINVEAGEAFDGFGDFLSTDASGVFTGAFLERVNERLEASGCEPMGSSMLEDGTLPWTRKFGSINDVEVGYGPRKKGDIIGRWIFNEWWAVLEELKCCVLGGDEFNPITFNVPISAYLSYYSEKSEPGNMEYDCGDVRASVHANWPTAFRTPPPIDTQDKLTYALGRIVRLMDEGGIAQGRGEFFRQEMTYRVSIPAVTDGEATVFAVGRSLSSIFEFTIPFESFGDGWAEGVIGQSESFALSGAAYDFNPAPFSHTCGIDSVPCPSGEGVDNYAGFALGVLHMLVRLNYPEP